MQPSELTSHPVSEEEIECVITTLYEYIKSANAPEDSIGTPAEPNINVYRYSSKQHELLDKSLTAIISLRSRLSQKEEECEQFLQSQKSDITMVKELVNMFVRDWNDSEAEQNFIDNIMSMIQRPSYISQEKALRQKEEECRRYKGSIKDASFRLEQVLFNKTMSDDEREAATKAALQDLERSLSQYKP